MAALIGKLKGNRGEASRLGTKASGISTRLETWQGAVTVSLEADGNFTVRLGGKNESGRVVGYGNVGDEGRRFVSVNADFVVNDPHYSFDSVA